MKFTKGPWEILPEIGIKNDSECYYRVRGTHIGEKFHIANVLFLVQQDGEPIMKDEAEANAKLIAAAPELLEACKMAFDNLRKGESETKYRLIACLNALEEAIKKATE